MSEIYGWITPKGEFEETKQWEHKGCKSIQDLWDELGYQDRLDGIEESCQSLIDDNEHPEWHRYEMAQDKFEWKVTREAYNRGFIRVGTLGMDMHFEYGSGCLVDGKLKACAFIVCKKFAETKGCAARFENVQ